MLYLTLIVCFLISIVITPIIKRLAFLIGATDRPNQRKVHQSIMPRLGGLAIFISFLVGIFLIRPENQYLLPILLGCMIIIITGFCDDMFELPAKYKLLGQLLAACSVVF